MTLKIPKTCLCCGFQHTKVADEHKTSNDPSFGGYYWNCKCGTTLFAKPQQVEKQDEPKGDL